MDVKEYWERRQKLEKEFFKQLEQLRKELNERFNFMDDFEDVCYHYFKRNFSEYYETTEG